MSFLHSIIASEIKAMFPQVSGIGGMGPRKHTFGMCGDNPQILGKIQGGKGTGGRVKNYKNKIKYQK